ncbi:MAG: FAD-binding protein, partial [Pseudomonadota bacterium]
PAPTTRFQNALGIEDSPEAFIADIQKKAAGGAHPGITATAARAIGPALEWLTDRHRLEWVVLDDFRYPGHSAHRMHAVPEKTGAALIGRLNTAAETAGLDIVTGAHVTALLTEGDAVRGVRTTRPDGKTETIRACAIILACNGYGGNPDLVARHIPEIATAPYFGHAGNTGNAVLWGQGLGAETRDLTAYQGHGSVAHPHGILITWALMMEGGIQVNAAGQRFSNEHEGYSEQSVKVLAQPGGVAWNVYDARLHEMGMGFPDYVEAVGAGAVMSGTVEEIADRIGCPSANLTDTLAEAHGYASGATDPFGRDFTGKPALEPPYFAIKVTGALFHTQGGLVVDEQARVIRSDGTPIPGLFAGGGAACGVSGSRVEGYLSGNGLLTAVALGYVAGASAARD